jgi:hypothetical protein
MPEADARPSSEVVADLKKEVLLHAREFLRIDTELMQSNASIARTVASALQGDSTAQKNLKDAKVELGPLLEQLLNLITNVNELTKEEKKFILDLLNTVTPWP